MTIKSPVIRTLGGAAARVADIGSVEVAFDQRGAATAKVNVPRLVNGSPNPRLLQPALFPDGAGALIEIDGRDLGTNERGNTISVPDAWLGRVTDPEGGDTGTPEATITAAGPGVDLEQENLPALSVPITGSGGDIARAIVQNYPNDLRIDIGEIQRGIPSPATVDGGSVWEFLNSMAEDRGEEFRLTALPGRGRWRLDWFDALAAPDLTGGAGPQVVLYDDGVRQNCRITPAYKLTRPRTEVVAAGAGWRNGGQLAVKAGTTSVAMGRKGALMAAANTTVVQRLAGGQTAFMRPDLSTLPALEAAAAAELRRLMRPVLPVQIEVLDTGLWRYMRPLNVVLVRLPKEMTGLYRRCSVQIRTATFCLTPPLGCSVSGELWAVDA